jgi:hypothetical protein
MGQEQWFRRWITRGSWFEVSLGKKFKTPSQSIKKLYLVVHACHSNYSDRVNRELQLRLTCA